MEVLGHAQLISESLPNPIRKLEPLQMGNGVRRTGRPSIVRAAHQAQQEWYLDEVMQPNALLASIIFHVLTGLMVQVLHPKHVPQE